MLYPNQIKHCRECGGEITFIKSSAGNWYPADVDRSSGKPEIKIAGQGGFVRGKAKSFTYAPAHVCPQTRPQIEAVINGLREQLMAQEAEVENGGWFDGTHATREAIRAWEEKLATLK